MATIRLSKLGPCAVVALGLAILGVTEARASFQDLLVTNLVAGNVAQFNPITGAPLSPATFGSPPLANPRGITVGPDNNIYVDDIATKHVEKFNGTTLASLGAIVTTGLNQPYGLAFGPNGNLFVADLATSAITQYTSTGTPVAFTITGGPGLNAPTGLTFDNAGHLFVANSGTSGGGANQVLEFTISGNNLTFLQSFSNAAVISPSGIAIGGNTLYVGNGGNTANNVFSMFNATTGAFIGSTTDATHLNTVGGLGFANNELYVTSFGTNSVVVYTAAGAFDKVLVTESGTPGPIYLSVLNVVPEPTSFALLTIGVLGLAGAGLRRARRGSRES